jgi:hypothetical protein
MSTFRHTGTTRLYASFYWIGVAMTAGCFALVLAGNTEMLWKLEHARFPMSWAFGALAVLSFLAAEVCPPASDFVGETEEYRLSSAEWEPAGD